MATNKREPNELVRPEAFVRTYANPSYPDAWTAVEDYWRVMDYAAEHTELGSSAVSNRLELPRGRIRQWMNGSRPDCLRGLQVAEENGWIGVDSTSDTFRGLNAMVSWTFSGGSIDQQWFRPFFVVRDDLDRAIVDRAAESVGTEVDITRSATKGRAQEVRPIEHASVLGRVLVVLGAPVGEKNEENVVALPPYLSAAPQRIAREFVQVYLHNRAQVRQNTDMLRFRESRSLGYLESLAALIRRSTGEQVTLSEKNVHVSAAAAREIASWQPLLDLEA